MSPRREKKERDIESFSLRVHLVVFLREGLLIACYARLLAQRARERERRIRSKAIVICFERRSVGKLIVEHDKAIGKFKLSTS